MNKNRQPPGPFLVPSCPRCPGARCRADPAAQRLTIHLGRSPHLREYDVRLRLRPRDDSYYDLFIDSANNLVIGARLLVELMSDGADREAITDKMRAREQDRESTRLHYSQASIS